MRLRKRLRMLHWMSIVLAAAAFAAPSALAMAVSEDGGVSAGQVAIGGGNGVSGQVATGGGQGISSQVATDHSAGASAQITTNGGGQGVSASVEDGNDGFSWRSAFLAGSALAALGVLGMVIMRRPQRRSATLSI